MKTLALGLLLLLSACGQSVSGNGAYVTVGNAWNDSDALPAAEEHCASYGKTARYVSKVKYRITFDCVKA